MSVSKRLLWVNRACYPLGNIARVHTYVVTPDRGAAVKRFLVIAILPILVLALAIEASGDGAGVIQLVCIAILVYAVADLLVVLFRQPHSVLAIETTGAALAVLTSGDASLLADLVRRIALAIENPDTEFHVRVEELTVNTKNYTGDTVNIIGGRDHTGIVK
ncbi:DUF6232 family protein [Streptomyces sp. NBC_00094]|uniref:DUF6232 family protein n=1 Tax=Streptomyces sp. NBC_00094 TaxID=2903620 RepID=UPI00225000D5|nr:DUF6232 family protein [Streptomyces sp. NBC_00094]MCX5391641.1 DUF6232 family protein [Streptomyces sp. NBC_00094]